MAKGMKRGWREGERKARRKKFLEEATKEPNGGKKARRKKFLEEATKEPKKKTTGTYKRGRRAGQTTGSKAGDLSKAELYKQAKAIKDRDKRNEPISTFNKQALQKYILKHD